MSNPKVTLLQPSWSDYTLIFGKKRFQFFGSTPKEVPPAVALTLRKVRDKKGNPLFKIEGMPTIVTPKVEEKVPALAKMQNGLGEIQQRSLLECL